MILCHWVTGCGTQKVIVVGRIALHSLFASLIDFFSAALHQLLLAMTATTDVEGKSCLPIHPDMMTPSA